MPNKLYIVSGVSGSGKTSIMREVFGKVSEIVSFTTRSMREGEVEGVDYNFITLEQFETLKSDGGIVESTQYSGNYYGVTAKAVADKLRKGDAFIIVDCPGMKQIDALYPYNTKILFYVTKSEAVMNMFSRGDDFVSIHKRLKTYTQEVSNGSYYDYVIRNIVGEKRKTVNIIRAIAGK